MSVDVHTRPRRVLLRRLLLLLLPWPSALTAQGVRGDVAAPAAGNRVQRNKIITAEAYERWNRILNPILSADGRWVAYTLETSRGAGELVVRATQSTLEFRTPRGDIPHAESWDDWV